jgi:6-phospho-3-hexuloisomerase
MKKTINSVVGEISSVLNRIDENQVRPFIEAIFESRSIVIVGAGRVGLAGKGFSMRLGHLGMKAFFLGDSTVPKIGSGDLLIVLSGSGETQTIFDITQIAKNNQCKIIAITSNKESRIAKICDSVIELKTPSKTVTENRVSTCQPMTTLNEQCLQILLDCIVLKIMERTGEDHNSMWKRHSNLE